jgi:hypothetical protein
VGVLNGRPLLVGVALCATTPVAAGAAVQPVARTDSRIAQELTDVSLAGDAVVWGELSPYRLGARRTWTVRLGRAGQRAHRRFSSRTPPTTLGADAPKASASATHLAVMSAGMGDDGLRRLDLLAGALEGPLTPITGPIVWVPPLLDWSGSVLVAREGDLFSGPVLTARDAEGGFAPRTLPLDPGTRELKAAGPYVASLITVGQIGGTEEQIDARIAVAGLDGQPAYSITAEDSFIWDYAVQADGKVAWLERRHVARGGGDARLGLHRGAVAACGGARRPDRRYADRPRRRPATVRPACAARPSQLAAVGVGPGGQCAAGLVRAPR